MIPRTVRGSGVLFVLFVAYAVAGKLGLQLAFAYPSATPVWPATGLALVAFLYLGSRCWPAIFLGAFVVNVTTAGTVLTSLGIATGNTLEGLLGAWLLTRFADGRQALGSATGIFRFVVLAAFVSSTVSATLGSATLVLAGISPTETFWSMWSTWWLGDASGDLLVAPVLLAWLAAPVARPTWRRALEIAALFLSLAVVSAALFGLLPVLGMDGAPLGFLSIPFLIWAAVRLGPRAAATAILVLGAIAVWGTLEGHGAFVQKTPNTSLLYLQAYMGVASIMTLMLAAAVAQRRAAEEQMRQLAIIDPLTGIANYRLLIARLDAEIERSGRNGRPFALLFFDVDGLKTINDELGHLAGSRALCRVAIALQESARVIDTAARYGGDEFALLLPETERKAAHQVLDRITERIRADAESPPIRVSAGISVYPEDGATSDALIGAADGRLYEGRLLAGHRKR